MVNIRNATIEDATALADLSTQLGYPTTIQESVGRLSAILRYDEHTVIVACSDGDSIVGWAHVFLTHRIESEPFAEVGGFIVEEQHRRKGVGRCLLSAVEEWVIHHGVKKLRVRCQSIRNDAHVFYEQLGFTRTKNQHVFDKIVTG